MKNTTLRLKKSPFPGMNPYLENRQLWRGFHTSLAVELVTQLVTQLGDAYAALLEVEAEDEITIAKPQRTRPDVAIVKDDEGHTTTPTATLVATPPTEITTVLMGPPEKQKHIHILLADTEELVTSIEILLPTNKRGRGLEKYREKRQSILMSDVHLVEIDLLRTGKRPGLEVSQTDDEYDYAVVVNRTGQNRISEIWRFGILDTLPVIPVPLLYPDEDVLLDLGAAVETLYTKIGLGRAVNYNRPIPKPILRPEVAKWWKKYKSELSVA